MILNILYVNSARKKKVMRFTVYIKQKINTLIVIVLNKYLKQFNKK